MSMIACEECGFRIDSDDDPDCFVYTGNYTRLHSEKVMCEGCREEFEWECERNEAQAGWAEEEAETATDKGT